MTASIEQCKKLLTSAVDEEKFVGLLLIPKIVKYRVFSLFVFENIHSATTDLVISRQDDAKTLREIFDFFPFPFIDRLVISPGTIHLQLYILTVLVQDSSGFSYKSLA